MNAGNHLSTNIDMVIQHNLNVGEPTCSKQLHLTVFSGWDSVCFSMMIDKLLKFSQIYD